MTVLVEDILHERLSAQFAPSELVIQNDSALHAGHNQAAREVGQTHFTVRIVSDAFAEKSRVQRHQAVYALIKDEMAREGGLHALVIQAFTPEEAAGAKVKI